LTTKNAIEHIKLGQRRLVHRDCRTAAHQIFPNLVIFLLCVTMHTLLAKTKSIFTFYLNFGNIVDILHTL